VRKGLSRLGGVPLEWPTAMTTTDSTRLELAQRTEHGSRAMRRLRRSGRVPGIIYGGDAEPLAFEVDARILRNTLAHAGAVLDVSIDGGSTQPAMVKDLQRHPIRGEILHADLLRVDLTQTIQTTVVLEITGADEAPGVTEGGVLSQETRELNVEALPGDLPDSIVVDVSGMQLNETLGLDAVTAPDGVTLLDDPETTVIATITAPTAEPTDEDIETETELVGEGVTQDDTVEEAQAAGDTGDEAADAVE
jgi:large subunit ribosomal protein L25